MDFSRKSRILIVSVILLWSGIQGQLDGELIKICDLCNMENLLDCNSTNSIHINMTISCEIRNKTCILGINELFEGIDNSSMQRVNREYVCLFKDISSELQNETTNPSTAISLNEKYENLRISAEEDHEEKSIDPTSISLHNYQSAFVNISATAIPTNPLTTEGYEHSYTTIDDNVVLDSFNVQHQDTHDMMMNDVEDIQNSVVNEPSIAVPRAEAQTGNFGDSDSTETTPSLEKATTLATVDERLAISSVKPEDLENLSSHQTQKTLLEEATKDVTDVESVHDNSTAGVVRISQTKEEETTKDVTDVESVHDNSTAGVVRSSETKENVPPPAPETISCFSCTSSTDKACLDRVEKEIKTIECPIKSGCSSYFLDGNVVRNCSQNDTPEWLESCQKPENTSCVWCSDAKCNRNPWTQCFQCNSKDDPNCALFSKAETIPLAVCPHYTDKCSVRVTKDGDTIRDCLREDDQCPPDLCSICDGPVCNSGVFPAKRLQCIQCEDCAESQDPSTALPCQHYNPNEQCFLYVTATNKMIRGCVSNATEMQECQANKSKCVTCSDTSGCNSVPLMKNPSLSCNKCKSKDDPSCAWTQPETSASKCINKFPYYLEESCVTDFKPPTQEVVRECSFDYGACTPEDPNCYSCSGNGCNAEKIKVQECIQCSSDQPDQTKCGQKAEGIVPTKCPQEIQLYETRGCFSLTKGNVTSRGCIVGLMANDYGICKNGTKKSCDLCFSDGCNNLLAPPSDNAINIHLSMFALISSFLITHKTFMGL